MKYIDGIEVMLGDNVLVDGEPGIVVAVIDSGQYSETYTKGWGFLERGALIEAKVFGLIHYLEADEDLVFVDRQSI